ncbi:MAG: glycine oxidase ThiO [Gammaproteobacteria bacterium]|nr:glycine oxidase ThiO [Gammaproteobacteria bacterium]
MSQADVLVVGGGILGMLSARELRLAGARVTLLERGQTGRESTWAGGGILSPLYPWRYAPAVTRLASWGQARYPQLCAELTESTGISPQWKPDGLLILDTEEQQQALDWARRFERPLRLIEEHEISQLEPALANPPEQALWLETIAQVRNPRMAKSLRAELARLGVDIREQTPMQSLLLEGDRVTGVKTPTADFHADQVLLCAGAWTGQLIDAALQQPPIRPVRGQMILFRAQPATLQRICLFDGHYCIAREDGRVLMGSTLEEVGFDKSTTATARAELQQRALARFPCLAQAPIEHHWAGLRPGSPEGIPTISAHPQLQGLYINTGHYRNGVVLGLASARLAADLLLGREPILAAEDYVLN